MKRWIDRLLAAVVSLLVVALLVSTIGWMTDGHLQGRMLLFHMTAAGALVFVLPLMAISMVWQHLRATSSGTIQRLGFWTLILAGVGTIGSVLLCMMPIASTGQMHDLMRIHSYAGFAMVPAVAVWIVGASRWRRIRSARSATAG